MHEVDPDMRTIGMLTVLVLAGATFIFTANPHLRKDQKDVVVFIVIVAVIAVVGITAALISWRRSKVRPDKPVAHRGGMRLA